MNVRTQSARVGFAILLAAGCGSSPATPSGAGGMPGMAGRGGKPMPMGAGGISGVAGSTGTTGAGAASAGGTSGVFSCKAGVEQLVITDCGYPYVSSNPLTSVVFNESEVLEAIQPVGTWPSGVVRVFYSDEHALTLGVRSVVVNSSSGSTTTDYSVAPLTSDPGSATNPATGTNLLSGDQSGLDPSLRPMWPSMFITDITSDASSKAGDWQQGGRPLSPNVVYGSWKAAVRTVDKTQSPATVTITPDADPAKNNWNLAGGDTPPSGLSNQGFGAEAVWNVALIPAHSYRIQVIVHDGDQNKAGGDSGEACVLYCAGGTCPVEGCTSTGYAGTCGSEGCTSTGYAGTCGSEGCTSTGYAGSSGGPSCPENSQVCGPGGIAPSACPASTVCANGCCILSIG
jgi:hypothetical protein